MYYNEKTHEYFVGREIADLLKQAGFDWLCQNGYLTNSGLFTSGNFTNNGTGVAAPTLDAAQRWLREEKDFDINILTDFDSVKRLYYVRYIVKDGHYKTYYITNNQSYVYFNTYEEAQEAGIQKCLTILLEEKK